MIRTQIQLTEDQTARIKVLAGRRGVSIAELIRQGIDTVLSSEGERSQEELYERAAKAAGCFHSGGNDIASRHDEHLSGAFSR